ncbi:MAG: chemotaxis protein CheW [Deltaproteobacteria bacterium]|nr:chemotaxis protein CheW [Deltaproteobacteria bacterium]
MMANGAETDGAFPFAGGGSTEGELALLFRLGRDRFAVSARLIQEVCPLSDLVPVPRAPDFVFGVVNRRGRIVTVIDLAHLLNAPRTKITATSLVLTSVERRGEVGFIVDAIESVESIAPDASGSVLTGRGTAERLFLDKVMTNLESFFD